MANELFGGEIIKKKIKGYLKNLKDQEVEFIDEFSIYNKNKLTYVKDNIKHNIIIRDKEIILIRESNEFKNILTFSKNRSILSEYIIKENNISIYIEIKTIELIIKQNEIYVKYIILDSDTEYEYKIVMEE